MARYSGKGGLVYMSTTGAAVATALLRMREWTLNMPTDKQETTAFSDSNKTYVLGYEDVSGALSGFWDDTDDGLYDGSISASGVLMYLYPTSSVLTKYWYGPAWVDFSISVSVDAPVSISGDFVANGNWGQY